MERHFPRPNESLTLETNANHKPAEKSPLTPLLHTHAMVFKTRVNSTENTCCTYIGLMLLLLLHKKWSSNFAGSTICMLDIKDVPEQVIGLPVAKGPSDLSNPTHRLNSRQLPCRSLLATHYKLLFCGKIVYCHCHIPLVAKSLCDMIQ